MARTRWPPGPVNPGLCTGQADQTGSAGGCQSRGPADKAVSRQPETASADSEVRPDPGPTLRPHHRKTAEAGPKHYPHPPCRLFAVIEGYCEVVVVAPDLPVLRWQLLPVVRGVPRWWCA